MRSILLILSALLLSATVFAQKAEKPKEIQWLSWNDAIAARTKFIEENKEAIATKKMFPKKFFIDIYTNWCGWCKRMDASTFKDPVIVNYLNEHYHPVKLNAEMKDTVMFNGRTFFNSNPGAKRSTHTLAASLLDSRLSYPSYVILDENLARSMIFPGYKVAEDLYGILIFYKTNQHLGYKQYVENEYKLKNQSKAN